jgi:hypothetical protein
LYLSREKVLVTEVILRCLQTFVYYHRLVLISFSKAALWLENILFSNKADCEQNRNFLSLALMLFSFSIARAASVAIGRKTSRWRLYQQINWDKESMTKKTPKSGLTWRSAKLLFLKCRFALCVCARRRTRVSDQSIAVNSIN